jgi:hypothetical protein
MSEMSLNFDSLSGCVEQHCSELEFYGSPLYRTSKETFVIDGQAKAPGVVILIPDR